MSGEEPDDGRIGTKLLADLKEIWKDSEPELFTSTLLERLHQLDESPWKDWGRRREPITPRVLADLLKPYRVKSQNIRIGGEQAKGYYRADLVDTWHRYVPDPYQPSQHPEEGESPSQPGDGNTDYDPSHIRPNTQGSFWDGNGTDSDSDIRPAPDKGKQSVWDAGTDGTPYVRTESVCLHCDTPLTNPGPRQRGTCGTCFMKTAS